MQVIGSCLETAEFDDRGERRELARIEASLTGAAQ
jgi:hypothetical protein